MNHLQNSCLGLHQIDWIKHTCELGWVGPLFSIRQGRRRQDTTPHHSLHVSQHLEGFHLCKDRLWGHLTVWLLLKSTSLPPIEEGKQMLLSVYSTQRRFTLGGFSIQCIQKSHFHFCDSLWVFVTTSGWGHDRERLLCSDSTDSPQLRVSWKKGELTWWLRGNREAQRGDTQERIGEVFLSNQFSQSTSVHWFIWRWAWGSAFDCCWECVSTDGQSLDSTTNPKRPSVTMWKSWETSQSSPSPFWQMCVICVSFVWCL